MKTPTKALGLFLMMALTISVHQGERFSSKKTHRGPASVAALPASAPEIAALLTSGKLANKDAQKLDVDKLGDKATSGEVGKVAPKIVKAADIIEQPKDGKQDKQDKKDKKGEKASADDILTALNNEGDKKDAPKLKMPVQKNGLLGSKDTKGNKDIKDQKDAPKKLTKLEKKLAELEKKNDDLMAAICGAKQEEPNVNEHNEKNMDELVSYFEKKYGPLSTKDKYQQYMNAYVQPQAMPNWYNRWVPPTPYLAWQDQGRANNAMSPWTLSSYEMDVWKSRNMWLDRISMINRNQNIGSWSLNNSWQGNTAGPTYIVENLHLNGQQAGLGAHPNAALPKVQTLAANRTPSNEMGAYGKFMLEQGQLDQITNSVQCINKPCHQAVNFLN